MASYPAVKGRQAAVDFVSSFQTVLESSTHFDVKVHQCDDLYFLEGKIKYVLKNGKEVVAGFLNKLRVDKDGLATFYRVYIDTAPLMQAIQGETA